MSAPGGPQPIQRPSDNQANTNRGVDSRRNRRKVPGQARALVGQNPQSRNPTSAPQANEKRPNKPKIGSKGPGKKPSGKPSGDFPSKNGLNQRPPTNQKPPTNSVEIVDNISITPTQRLPKQAADPIQKFSQKEIAATGLLFQDPSSFGFLRNRSHAPLRHTPRYMLNQPRLLVAPEYSQDPWDAENQAKMLRIEQANSGSDYQGVYEEFQKMREVERKKMEELGLVDAENVTKDLNDAIFFQGTCTDMCPTFERVRRALENNVKALEKDPATQKISRDKAVKAFSRPAAGQPPPMPSDVRPPHILLKTLDFIVDNILHQLPEAHSFIWDRTRSIRQDFVYQNYYGPEAIDCNERIVRIHLLSFHIMAGSDVEYSQQQELEQFNKALQTLTEIYQDVRNHGGKCPNEAEFRAYHLISHFRDPELEREIQLLPDSIFMDSKVQLALRFRSIMSQNNVVERGYTNCIGAINLFVEFFRLVNANETPLLLACLLETHFNEIRFYALKSMSRSYHTKGKAFLGESLREMLGFDTVEQLVNFVSYYDIDIINDNGTILVDLCNKEKLESQYKLNSLYDKATRSQAFSARLDARMRQTTLAQLVNSGLLNSNLNLNKSNFSNVLRNVTRKPISSKASVAPIHSGSFGLNPASSAEMGLQRSDSTDMFSNGSAFGGTKASGFGQNPVVEQTSGFDGSSRFGKDQAGFQGTFGQKAAFGLNVSDSSAQNGSFNLADFMKKQNTDTGVSKSAFGQVPEAGPKFDFTAKPKVSDAAGPTNLASSTESAVSKTNLAPSTNSFPMAKPHLLPSEKPLSTLPPLFSNEKGLGSGKAKSVSFELPVAKDTGSSVTFKQEAKPVSLLPSSAQPMQAKNRLLKDKPLFNEAVSKIYQQILDEAIESELLKVLPRIVKHENRSRERERVLQSLASELYQAFFDELTYLTMLLAVADYRYNSNLKKKVIRNFIEVGKKSQRKRDEKAKRMEELKAMNFGTSLFKRKRSSSNFLTESLTKRKSTPLSRNTSFDHMGERQKEIQKLWQPLDIELFARVCAHNVKTLAQDPKVELKCLLVAEDWTSPYSKWLNTKFSLKPSSTKNYYSTRVEVEKMILSVESLPHSLSESSFRNIPFLVFECGLLEEKQLGVYKTLRNKLNRDSGILLKIIQLCNRYCLYRIQILVLVWDISNNRAGFESDLAMLRVEEHKSKESCIQDIRICDMSLPVADVADLLQYSFMKLGQNFDGLLTERGLRKKAKITQEPKPTSTRSLTPQNAAAASEDKLKLKETELLEKARHLQKRRYLSKHTLSAMDNSVDLSNTSAFRTPNASFANNTLVNFNNSFLSNNTIQGNASHLGSFGNASIIEESTPFGSPRGFKPPFPKKVQELRDLTASIKARYKREV